MTWFKLTAYLGVHRSFIDPVEMHDATVAIWLIIPLIVAVSLIYKTLKMQNLKNLALETIKLSGYILLLIFIAAVALFYIVKYA